MPRSRAAVCAALLTIAGLSSAGCGASTPSVAVTATAPPFRPEELQTTAISIAVGDERYRATLRDSAAGRDLIAQLPLTIVMTDHGGVEKTGPLPSPLSPAGQPDGADPDVGDLGYYAPGNDLVLYSGDQSYYPGIVILGRLEGDAAARLAARDGAVTVAVARG